MKEERKFFVTFLALFILSFFILIPGETVSNAEQSGGTDMGIEFTEDYVPAERPDPKPFPPKPYNPPAKSGLLPQTGEKEVAMLSVVGGTLLIASVAVMVRRKEELN